jgi:hypothetical protein
MASGEDANLADRRKILERVVGQAGINELIERVPACHQDQRVTIRRRLSQGLRCDDAAGTRTVLDDRLLAPGLCQGLAERAREHVHRTARRIRHQDVDGLVRKIFGVCADADQQQCRSRDETADLLAHTHHTRAVLLVLLCCGSSARPLCWTGMPARPCDRLLRHQY